MAKIKEEFLKVQEPNYSKANHRIPLLDSLRGYALMGLFLVHMIECYELYWYKPVDSTVKDVVFFLFGGKSYALFALFFGVSFSILFTSAKRKEISFNTTMLRRFSLLFLFGLIHGLLYGGDILQILSFMGFLMLVLHHLPNRFILVISALFLLQLPFIIYLILVGSRNGIGYEQPFHWALYGPVYEGYAHGNIADVIYTNLTIAPFAKWAFMLESGRISTIIGISLLGYVLGKNNFLKQLENNPPTIIKYLILSACVWIVLYFTEGFFISKLIKVPSWLSSGLIHNYMDLALTMVSFFLFSLLFQVSFLQRLLTLLSPCGKMSLTLYIFQSVVFVPFFYGFGFSAYEWITPPVSLIIGLLAYLGQIMFAHYWLKYHEHGLLEWLWRKWTQPQKIPEK